MPELEPPKELVDLKARWYTARDQANSVAQETPQGERLHLPGPIEKWLFSDSQNARLTQARDELRQLTLEIYRHPWKRNPPGDRGAAERALNKAAKAQLAAKQAQPVG